MQQLLKNNSLRLCSSIVTTIAGTFIMAIGFTVFLVPNDIVAGGFSGFALLLSNIFEELFSITISKGLIYIFLNIPIYLFGLKNIGKNFAILSLVDAFAYSFFIDYAYIDIGVKDSMLCSLYGGIFSGIGLGIVIRGNGSTGGSDMLGTIIHRKVEKISVGSVVLAVDIFVISSNVIYTGTILAALYAILAIFIQSLITDFIAEGPRSIKAYYVISEHYEKIAKAIIHDLKRGVTAINAQGMFSFKEKKMLVTLVSRRQITKLNSIVFSIDPTAFVFSTNCKDAIGNGFSKPTKKSTTSYRLVGDEKIEKKQEIVNTPHVNN